MAVPSAVAKSTFTVSGEAPLKETVNVNAVVPESPSFWVTSSMDISGGANDTPAE